MGWTFFYEHHTRTTTRKEFAEFCLSDFAHSTGVHGNLMYRILDHSLNKDGLTMLASYTQEHIDFINAEKPRDIAYTTDDKFIIHLLLSSSDCKWGYKDLDCSCGISINNCPKRIIDKYKDNNPRYERLLKLYEQGERHYSVDTIKGWEKAYADKQIQTRKDKGLREVLKLAFEKGDSLIEVELRDGLKLIQSGREIPMTGRYPVSCVLPKKQYFTIQCHNSSAVKVNYGLVTALIDKSTGNILWGEPRKNLKSA